MIKIGNTNHLEVSRLVEFGAYLREQGGLAEVLLPARYIEKPLQPGDELDVFVYTDSEDRPVATTLRPKAEAGRVAVLEVVALSRAGAFLDWGLAKDLLVPRGEQRTGMVVGRRYPVYVYLDDASKRPVASAKIDRHLGQVIPDLHRGDKVEAVVFARNDAGWRCAVNSLHLGIIYADEVYEPLNYGDSVEAYVKTVRPDGKIDLSLRPQAAERSASLAERIEQAIADSGGRIALGDHSSPEAIAEAFRCSKKDFKKALGLLLKQGRVKREQLGD